MSEETIQQSLLDEQMRIDMDEYLHKMQKDAFRAAFDFLVRHDPPENTEEYWTQFAEDVREVSGAHMKNELCQRLLTAVVLYLDDKQKVLNRYGEVKHETSVAEG